MRSLLKYDHILIWIYSSTVTHTITQSYSLNVYVCGIWKLEHRREGEKKHTKNYFFSLCMERSSHTLQKSTHTNRKREKKKKIKSIVNIECTTTGRLLCNRISQLSLFIIINGMWAIEKGKHSLLSSSFSVTFFNSSQILFTIRKFPSTLDHNTQYSLTRTAHTRAWFHSFAFAHKCNSIK